MTVAAATSIASTLRACFNCAKCFQTCTANIHSFSSNCVRNHANFPLFAKPELSPQGFGCAYLPDYDRSRDTVLLFRGGVLPQSTTRASYQPR